MNKDRIYVKVISGEYKGREGFYYKSQYDKVKDIGGVVMQYSKEGIHPWRAAVPMENLVPIKPYIWK